MDKKKAESCIQTLQMLRRAFFRVYELIDVVDDQNISDMIELLKQQGDKQDD